MAGAQKQAAHLGNDPSQTSGAVGATQGRDRGRASQQARPPGDGSKGRTRQQPGVHRCVHRGARAGGPGGPGGHGLRGPEGCGGWACGGEVDVGHGGPTAAPAPSLIRVAL